MDRAQWVPKREEQFTSNWAPSLRSNNQRSPFSLSARCLNSPSATNLALLAPKRAPSAEVQAQTAWVLKSVKI
jgi:hypothetical protein